MVTMPSTQAQARIVVGVDGSPASVAALRWAVREAKRTGCTVEAVHVWTASPSPFDRFSTAQAGFRSEHDAARDVLGDAVAQARDVDPDGSVPLRGELVPGYPRGVLRQMARGARMVVVGSPREGRLSHLWHTSVAHSVAKDAPCLVVIVAPDGTLLSREPR